MGNCMVNSLIVLDASHRPQSYAKLPRHSGRDFRRAAARRDGLRAFIGEMTWDRPSMGVLRPRPQLSRPSSPRAAAGRAGKARFFRNEIRSSTQPAVISGWVSTQNSPAASLSKMIPQASVKSMP